jgi:NTE family protein
MNRKKVGLALGGGIARGLAHIGVIRALEKAGIPIDCVVGSSAGSVIGAAYCTGMGIQRVEEVSQRLHLWQMISLRWPSRGILSFNRLEKSLVNLLGDIDFASLKIPFAIVATDLINDELIMVNEGKLAPAVHASCSIPGFIVPVQLNGRLLGDGSLLSSVPVSSAREMGADYVIGVDLLRTKIRTQWGALGFGFSALEILIRHAGQGVETADCLISPMLLGVTYFRFTKGKTLIRLGEQAAKEKIPMILNALSTG